MEDNDLNNLPFKVRNKVTVYPEHVVVYEPRQVFTKNNPKRKSTPPNNSNYFQQKRTQETAQERSLRRTKKAVRDYVLCNEFQLFATFTFGSERSDMDRCRSRMANWLKRQAKLSSNLQYLIVPELHKSGDLHFHAVIKGFEGTVHQAVDEETSTPKRNKKGRFMYNLPSFRAGFTDVKKIDRKEGSLTAIANYLTKYITKNMPVFPNKNRYWASHGLKIPPVIYNIPDWYKSVTPIWGEDNEFGRVLIYPRSVIGDENTQLVQIFLDEDVAAL